MADKTITDLTVTTSAAAADEIPIWVAASSATRKITKANFMGGVLTGAGTVATGGFTLTVPATGTAALLGTANTFTQSQVINANSAQFTIARGGVDRFSFVATASATQVNIFATDIGNTLGPFVSIGHNNNSSTPSAGVLLLANLSGTSYRHWVDAAGLLRIHTANPTNANDTAGTVVGAQTSMAAAKHISDGLAPITEVLTSIQHAAAQAVKRFTYRSGSFNGQEFEGVVTDLAPRYGMDRDAAHPAGKSLNEITLLGDLLRAVAYLAERVERLEK